MNNNEFYIDGYVLPVEKNNIGAYKRMAGEAGKIWMKHWALQYIESVAEDLTPDVGGMKITTFQELVKPASNETVIFAFIVYKSRAHRDEVNKKVMEDPDMNNPEYKDLPMPFDMNRMCYWWFQSIVSLSSNK